MKFLTLLLVAFSLSCASRIAVDPRDQEAIDRIEHIDSSVLVKVTSGYFGTVKVSVMSGNGGHSTRLGSAPNGETDLSFRRDSFSNGSISFLLEPQGSGGAVYRAMDITPMGEYRFLLEGIFIAGNTEVIFLNITNALDMSSASWY